MRKAFYPPLVAAFLVLALFNANSHQLVSASVVVFPLLISIGGACALWTLTRLILGSWNRAALPTCALTIMLIEYGHVRGILNLSETITLTLWLVGLILVATALAAIRRPPTRVLNAMAIGALVVALVSFSVFALYSPMLQPNTVPNKAVAEDRETPDIYYIVLDEYSREDILLDRYDFNNSEFTDYLRDKGFYVSNDSYSNYMCTTPTLLAALNMRYLDVEHNPYTVSELFRATWASIVPKYLKQEGYTLIQMGTSFRRTDVDIDYAEATYPEFTRLFQKMSVFYSEGTLERATYDTVLYRFKGLKEVARMPEPTFTFVHILTCHSPYVFNADGTYRGATSPSKKQLSETYIHQIQATNILLQEAIDTILAKGNAVIILQSDNSRMPDSYPQYSAEHRGAFDNVMQEDPYIVRGRLAILNAVYSDCDYKFTSPVNTFRSLFNHYFNTDYEILPDRYFWAVYGLKPPWDVFEVTDSLESEGER